MHKHIRFPIDVPAQNLLRFSNTDPEWFVPAGVCSRPE